MVANAQGTKGDVLAFEDCEFLVYSSGNADNEISAEVSLFISCVKMRRIRPRIWSLDLFHRESAEPSIEQSTFDSVSFLRLKCKDFQPLNHTVCA